MLTAKQVNAINTPKDSRTEEQRRIIFGDCNVNRKLDGYRQRALELVDRLDAGMYLTKADKKEARRYKKEGIL